MLDLCATSAKKHAFSFGWILYVRAVAEIVEVRRAKTNAHCDEKSIVAVKVLQLHEICERK